MKWSTVAMVEYSLLRILPEEFSIVVFCFEHHYHYSAILFVFLFVFFFFFVTLAQNNTYLLSDKKVYLAIGKMNLVCNWSKKLLHENDANNFTPHSLSSHKSNEGKFSVPSWKKKHVKKQTFALIQQVNSLHFFFCLPFDFQYRGNAKIAVYSLVCSF